MVTVVVALFLIASLAVLISHDSATNANMSNRELEADRSDYVAQAGMQHAQWRIHNNACSSDLALPTVSLGPDMYLASFAGAASSTNYTLAVDQDAWIRSDDVTSVNGSGTDQHIRFENGKIEQALFRFDVTSLPVDSNIYSAEAWFFIEPGKEHPEGAVEVFENLSSWTEADATWETLGDLSNNARIATIPAQDTGGAWVSFNMTSQVQSWANGSVNHGIVLASTAEGVHAEYVSREGAANQQPYIKVVVGTGPSVPIAVQVVGQTQAGTSRTLTHNNIVPSQAAATTVLPAGAGGKDGWVDSTQPSDNFGATGEMTISGGSNPEHFLAEFDLDGIPKGSRIISATLEMYMEYMSSNDPAAAFSVHRMSQAWSEGTGDHWNPGNGANWNTSDGSNAWDWTTNHDVLNSVAVTSVNPGYTGWHSWDITTLAQGWMSGIYPNFGLLIKGNPNAVSAGFRSSDFSNVSQHPKLTIKYACPCGRVCATPSGVGKIAFFVDNPFTPGEHDKSKKKLFEAWGYEVVLIDDNTPSFIINLGAPGYDAVYVSASVDAATIGSKLTALPNSIVTEKGELNNEFGIASGYSWPIGRQATILDASHYVTSVFPPGTVEFFDANMEGMTTNADGSGAVRLADWGGGGAVVSLEAGAQTIGGGSSPGRRISLPFGRTTESNFDYVNANGRLLMQRAIAWAMRADAGSSGKLLMVVGNDNILTSQEDAKKSLLESWGFAVSVIDKDDSQGEFDTAIASADVVFVTEDVNAADVSTKLTGAIIGVVSEEMNLSDELGISASIEWESSTTLNIDTVGHYITSTLAVGPAVVFSSTESVARLDGAIAPGLSQLASLSAELMLVALDTGANTYSGGNAAGRRVLLPWGGDNMDVNNLTADGLTIFRRALEWGIGASLDLQPVAHWKLDETSGTTAKDAVGNNDGLLLGNWTWTTGEIDGGLALDYTDGQDYIDIPNSTGLQNVQEGDYTLAAWFRPDSTPPGSGSDNDAQYGILIKAGWHTGISFTNDNRFAFDQVLDDDSRVATLSANTFSPGDFYHVAGVIDRSAGTQSLYVNGQLEDTINFTPGAAAREYGTESWKIGVANPYNPTWGWQADGVIDDVRIYDRALSAQEISEIAAEGSNGGPIAHWKLDETSGSTAVDSIGGHNGTLVNEPSWTTGKLDGGLFFDGDDDYIVASSLNPMSYDDFTVSAWYKSAENGVSDDEYIFEHNDNFSYEITFGPTDDGTDDRLRFGFANGGSGTWDPHYGTSDIVDQQWHHVVGVRSGGRIKIYVDGVQETDGADAHAGATVTIDGDGPFIGDLPGNTERVHGTLDDVRLYDRALSDAEISDLFIAGDASFGGGGGGSCSGNFRDEFNAQNYSGNDGTLAWAGDWQETGESTNPTGGDIRVDDDISDYQLQVRDDGQTVWREVDLSTAGSATLSFDYRRQNLSGSNDYVAVEVSYDGGSNWSELDRFTGTATDGSYTSASYPLNAGSLSANTRIRFLTPNSGMGNNNMVWFDDVEIACN